MPYNYKLEKKGLEAFFKPWQIIVIKYLEETHPKWLNVKQITTRLNEDRKISRSSIIQFLYAMRKNKIMEYSEKTGKGGYQGLYRLKYKDKELREALVKHMIEALINNFPEETKQIINQLT